MPRLQVALDVTDLSRALSIAARVVEASDGHPLLLEAGTPLIKACGVGAVRALSERFPDIPIVADMKVADVGGLETELALTNGAKYVTVLAYASDETVRSVVETAHRLGGMVMADVMPAVGDVISRTVRLLEMGVDVVCYHVPVDVQRSGGVDWGRVLGVIKVLKALGAEVAVAGGIKPESARILAKAGADILVVGSFVHSSPDPGRAVRELLESIRG